MKTFKIEITETLSTVVETKANSIEEAVNKIEEEYRKSEIVLDAENHSSTNVDIFDISFIENNINFANFVLKKAEEALIDLSIEELAKIGFGSSIIAIDNFKKSKL